MTSKLSQYWRRSLEWGSDKESEQNWVLLTKQISVGQWWFLKKGLWPIFVGIPFLFVLQGASEIYSFVYFYICSSHPVLCRGHVLLLLEDGEVAPVVIVGNNNQSPIDISYDGNPLFWLMSTWKQSVVLFGILLRIILYLRQRWLKIICYLISPGDLLHRFDINS